MQQMHIRRGRLIKLFREVTEMTGTELMKVKDRVEDVCCETADKYKYIYTLAVAINLILDHLEKQMRKEKLNSN